MQRMPPLDCISTEIPRMLVIIVWHLHLDRPSTESNMCAGSWFLSPKIEAVLKRRRWVALPNGIFIRSLDGPRRGGCLVLKIIEYVSPCGCPSALFFDYAYVNDTAASPSANSSSLSAKIHRRRNIGIIVGPTIASFVQRVELAPRASVSPYHGLPNCTVQGSSMLTCGTPR